MVCEADWEEGRDTLESLNPRRSLAWNPQRTRDCGP